MTYTPLFDLVRDAFEGTLFRARMRRLEQTLARAEPTDRPTILHEMGDLHAERGDRRTAVRCFGAAIDALLADERFDAAAAMCRKVLHLYPDTVRAHGTLGILLLTRGFTREAEHELTRYVEAALSAGGAAYAVERLRMTGEVIPDPHRRRLVASLLASLRTNEELAPATGPARRPQVAALLRRPVTAQRVDTHAARPSAATARADELDSGDLPWLDVSLRVDAA
jgi:hypothetical protein